MNPQDIKELKSKKWGEPARNYDYTLEELMVAQAQAEISFKAGRESLLGEKVVAETLKRERQKGIMEVVELIFEHEFTFPAKVFDEWQAKLKGWFKDNPKYLKEKKP